MTRGGRVLGVCLIVLGLFWAGRESAHGLGAFFEQWWCPLPLIAVVLGTTIVLGQRLLPRA